MKEEFEKPAKPFKFSLPPNLDLGPIRLQGPQEFYQDLLGSIWDAQNHVYIRTMFYLPGEKYIPEITEHLKFASKRGVDVQVIRDGASNAFINQTEVGWPGKKLAPSEELFIRQNFEQMDDLKESGVTLSCSSPLRGRKRLVNFFKADHNKLFAIDGKIAWGAGGLGNLADRCFTWMDYIAKTEDPNFAEAIEDLILNYDKKPKENYSVSPIPGYDFLVDGGINKSLIFKRAIGMVEDEKTKVLLVSQFLPDGKLLEVMMDKARSGTEVVIYTSGLNEHFFKQWPYRWEAARLLRKIHRSEIELKYTTSPCRVHAKGLLNSNAAFITSHNLTRLGEWALVQENGIYSDDPRLRRQLKYFIESIPV